jgi:hypothetical protein
MCHSPPRLYLIGLWIEWSDSTDIHSFWYNAILALWFWLYHSCMHSLQDMVLYEMLTISGEFRVFLITLGLQPYIHKEFDSCFCFLFDWNYLQCPVFFFVFNTRLIWRQYCGSYLCQNTSWHGVACSNVRSNSVVTMQLIEGSNQMHYLLLLLDFHDCFPSQMIWACHWQMLSLCTCSMIAFACGLWLVVGLALMP